MKYDLLILGGDDSTRVLVEAATRRGLFVACVIPEDNEAELDFESVLLDVFRGRAEMVSEQTAVVSSIADGIHLKRRVTAAAVVIATGSKAIRPRSVRFNTACVLDCDTAAARREIPETAVVVGASSHGLRLAIRWANSGVRVQLLESQTPETFRRHADAATRQLLHLANEAGVNLLFGQDVITAAPQRQQRAQVFVRDRWPIVADVAVFAVGRCGSTEQIGLPGLGLFTDDRQRLWCDADGSTWIHGLYGFGDVVGFRPDHSAPSDAKAAAEALLERICPPIPNVFEAVNVCGTSPSPTARLRRRWSSQAAQPKRVAPTMPVGI